MSSPPSPGASLWPVNSQTVCVLDHLDVAHRSIKCPAFHDRARTTFTTTGLAEKAGKAPCFCLEELP
jgi:hypothetical protein